MIIGPIMMPPSVLVLPPSPPPTVLAPVTESVLSQVTPVFNPLLFFHVFVMPPMMTAMYSLTHTMVQLAGIVTMGIPF